MLTNEGLITVKRSGFATRSHRRYFPKRIEHKVPPVDPTPKRQHLQAEDESETGASTPHA
jgi:hypothetical protein